MAVLGLDDGSGVRAVCGTGASVSGVGSRVSGTGAGVVITGAGVPMTGGSVVGGLVKILLIVGSLPVGASNVGGMYTGWAVGLVVGSGCMTGLPKPSDGTSDVSKSGEGASGRLSLTDINVICGNYEITNSDDHVKRVLSYV